MSEAAAAVGLKQRQFTDLFRKVTGQSRRKYLLGLRLNHAAGLLAETDHPVTTVAFESGFDDLSYFNHSFKAAYGRAPLAYREQHQVRVPARAKVSPREQESSGFKFRGIKGWFWTPEQYLEEIPVLPGLKMNFLMNCYGSMMTFHSNGVSNEWWKPMSAERKRRFAKIIRACRERGIEFCFAMHPQESSSRPLDPASASDLDQFHQHYAWAQSQGVQWFSICLYGTSWDPGEPAVSGSIHAALANVLFSRLRSADPSAQLILYPVISWGDAASREHREYLGALARDMHPDIYVFWSGDSIRTPRVTRIAAESYKKAVNHRLFLWDNYPVNDGNPTLHLGPVSGRDPDLCEVIDGYLSNPMHTQNEINRIPLATCADYAFDPWNYNPARSIGQAILRLGKTAGQQSVLKDLVEAYPGFIVAGGASATNPVRGKFNKLMAGQDSRAKARNFIRHIEDIYHRLRAQFPKQFLAARKTIAGDIEWLKRQQG
jgi:AraC-like DNA-binding protein